MRDSSRTSGDALDPRFPFERELVRNPPVQKLGSLPRSSPQQTHRTWRNWKYNSQLSFTPSRRNPTRTTPQSDYEFGSGIFVKLRRLAIRAAKFEPEADCCRTAQSRSSSSSPASAARGSNGSATSSRGTVLTGIRLSSEQCRFVVSAKSYVEKAASRRQRSSER